MYVGMYIAPFVCLSVRLCTCTLVLSQCLPVYMGRSGGATVLGKLPVPGVLLIWIRVGQGPTALAVGAGGSCLDIFPSSIISLFFLPLSRRRPDTD